MVEQISSLLKNIHSSMEWTNELTLEFLDLYEGEPIIWNPKHTHHKERIEAYDAWKRIKDALSVDVSLKELKKKKDNLMSTYRKLSAKVNKSKIGGDSYGVYKPEWFAFEKMASFLHEVYVPRETQHIEVLEELEPSKVHLENKNCIEDDSSAISDEPELQHGLEGEDVTGIREEDGLPAGKKRRTAKVDVERRMDEAYHFLKTVSNKSTGPKDECDLFCDLLCVKLKAVDEETREIAMHQIDNLMFELRVSKRRRGNVDKTLSHSNASSFNIQTPSSPQSTSS